VIVNELPAAPIDADKPVIFGSGSTVNVPPVAGPAGVVTDTAPVEAPAGTTTSISVLVSKVTFVATFEPNFTEVAPSRFVPVITTAV